MTASSETGCRIGVASIFQETNTFASTRTTIEDFEAEGLLAGDDVLSLVDSNTEIGGAIDVLRRRGAAVAPLVKARASSGGPVTPPTLAKLAQLLSERIRHVGTLDGIVLSLHGALVGEDGDSGDLQLLRAARDAVGAGTPIGVCLDLHANVTDALIAEGAFVVGYHTYPHVDQASTGARAAELLLAALTQQATPVTRLAKRAMLVPPEAQGADGPLGRLREQAESLTGAGVLDISLFPVQPWLDVPELGFGVTVTTDAAPADAAEIAERLAADAWQVREQFAVELVAPAAAIERVRSATRRPVVLTESADAPTAGAAGDSPAMVRAFLEHGADLRAYTTLVDPVAVARMHEAGEGAVVQLSIGSRIDGRFHPPVEVSGRVAAIGDAPYRLTGPVFTGREVHMGRHARLDVGGLSVLVTERPASTLDPEAFRHVGLDPETADAVVVRSANLFRAGWGPLADGAIVLDLPGASTPRLDALAFSRIPRPMYPIDD
ncbi:MAG TPA: M81 family metallopeptidase [Conexibacter sp.]